MTRNVQQPVSNSRYDYQEKLEEKDKNIYLLQEEKSKLEAEIGKLRGQIMAKQNTTSNAKASSSSAGF